MSKDERKKKDETESGGREGEEKMCMNKKCKNSLGQFADDTDEGTIFILETLIVTFKYVDIFKFLFHLTDFTLQ